MDKAIRILIVEDSDSDAELIARELSRGDFPQTSKWVKSKEEFLRALAEYIPDMILCDYKMPLLGAPAALEIVKERCPEIPFIVVSGTIGEDTAIEMMKAGAADYVMKDRMARLTTSVKRALEEAQLRLERKQAEEAIRLSAQNWQDTFDAVSDAVWLLDPDHRILRSNKAAEFIFRKSAGKIVGRHCYEVIHGMDKPHPECPVEKMRRSGHRESTEFFLDGGWLWVTADPIFAPDGSLRGIVHIVSDITDRKRTERALLESESQFRTLFDESMDGILLADPVTQQLSMPNPQICKMLGYSAEEITKLTVADIHPANDLPRVVEAFEGLLRGDRSLVPELPVLRRDGTVFYADISTKSIELGTKKYALGVFRDVSERRRLETSLHESEAMFRGIFESSWDAMMILEPPSWRFTAGNPAMLRMFRVNSEAEFILHYPWTLSPERQPDGRISEEKGKAMIEIAMNKGVNFFEWTHQRIDGASFPAEVLLTRVARGGKIFLQSTVRDITERKRMELQLMQAKEMQLKALIELLPSKVFLKDRNSVYLSCNSNYARDLKIKPEEIAGKTDYDFFPTHLAEQQRDEDQRIMASGKTESREDEYHVIGEYLAGVQTSYINIVKAPVRDKSGAVVGLFGLFWDVTEQKTIEGEKKRLAGIQASADVKSKFTAMVSHELRSPVAVIKEALDIVLEGMTGSVSDQQKEILGMAKTNIERLGRLINNVLDFQKIESGKMKYDISENDLKGTLIEVGKSMNVLARKKGLDLKIDVDERLPAVRFDRDRLIQAVTNLMSNAINNTQKGRVILAAGQAYDGIHISVRDTGGGIPVEDLPKIFQPFEQVDGLRSKQRGGTGLGLAISKEIVLAHRGKIWVESEVGQGSTFHFTLPL